MTRVEVEVVVVVLMGLERSRPQPYRRQTDDSIDTRALGEDLPRPVLPTVA